MGSKREINTEIVKKEAREKHGDKYDYSLLEYVNYDTKLKIICPIHGLFEQKYQKHCKLGRGCWECGKISCVEKRDTLDLDKFIIKSSNVHSNFYNYSKSIFKGYNEDISIGCPLHGIFKQKVSSHIKGVGCPICGKLKASISIKKGKEAILERFKKFHGDFYKYEIDDDVRTSDKIKIECPIHGEFFQVVEVHYYCGCPKCGDERAANFRRKIPIELKRVAKNIKRRVKGFIANEGYRKSSSTSEIIGIDWEGLKFYLEDNPYNFKVDCEDLDLDHIIPLSSIEVEEDIYKLNHYTNLQLLPKVYNQFIKKNRPFDRRHFEDWLIEINYNKC